MSILQNTLEAIELLTTDNPSEQAQAAAADARIKLMNAMAQVDEQTVEPDAWLLCEKIYCLDQETWIQRTVCLTKFNEDCEPLYLRPPQQTAREYLATEPTPTITETLAQKGIKLRNEFEPKRLGDITFGGCPACGKQSCIARSCTTNKPTLQPLTPQEAAELRAAGVTGEVVRVLVFNDRPKAEPSGERAKLIAAHQELNMSNYGPDDVDELNDWANRAYDMLEADEQQAKPTDWDNGLSQDYCKELGQWLASRPGARQQVKEMLEADAQQAKPTDWSAA